MQFTEKDLNNLSNLARITIKDDEKEEMTASMKAILGYVGEINSASAESFSETSPLLFENYSKTNNIVNIVREDVITNETGSNTDALLANAPATEDSYVKVAQVLHTIK